MRERTRYKWELKLCRRICRPALVEVAEPPKATRRDWIGLAVIALPCLLYSMDLTVLHLAVPEIAAAHLKPSSAELLWIVDIYGFMVAGALITMGTLGDRIGRRRVLLIGAAPSASPRCSPPLATSPATLDRGARRARVGRCRACALDALPHPQHVPR